MVDDDTLTSPVHCSRWRSSGRRRRTEATAPRRREGKAACTAASAELADESHDSGEVSHCPKGNTPCCVAQGRGRGQRS